LNLKGWNDKPITHQVVTINALYYIMTQHVLCDSRSGDCGKSINL
jgi:hypothetical protein